MKTKIVISAVNLVEGGPLTILRSCLKALNDYSAYNDVEVLALVHKRNCVHSPILHILRCLGQKIIGYIASSLSFLFKKNF